MHPTLNLTWFNSEWLVIDFGFYIHRYSKFNVSIFIVQEIYARENKGFLNLNTYIKFVKKKKFITFNIPKIPLMYAETL